MRLFDVLTSLQRTGDPSTEPVTLTEAKRHLRIVDSDGEPAPGAPSASLAGNGPGNLSNGAYRYKITFVTADGETDAGTASSAVTVADNSADGQVDLSDIEVGGSAVADRKIYRTKVDASTYFLVGNVGDNTTTTFTDNVPDNSLGAEAPSTNSTEDPELNLFIASARDAVEQHTSRALITQTWEMKLKSFALWEIPIPRPPLQSVSSIQYIDGDGATQALGASNYIVDTDSEPGRVKPASGDSWPGISTDVFSPVTITFVAGYGAAGDVPKQLKNALLIQLAHVYETRSRLTFGTMVSRTPIAFESLLSSYVARMT